MPQDANKKTENSDAGDAKTSSKSGNASKSAPPTEQQPDESSEAGNSLLQVLSFLKDSNLINLDMPLKSLFDQVQHLQTDPSSEWGLIGDSGHWALVWQKKHD